MAAFDIRRTQHSVPLLSWAAARQSYARAWRRLRERWAPPEQGFFGFCFNPIDSPKMLLRSAEVSCSGERVFPLVNGEKLGTVPTDCHWRPELAEVAEVLSHLRDQAIRTSSGTEAVRFGTHRPLKKSYRKVR